MRGSLFLQTKRLLPRCSRHKRKNRPENQAGLLHGGNYVECWLYLTTPNSARRFNAHACSLLAGSAGISLPKLTV